MIRSHSASSSESFRPVLGRGQQQEQGPPDRQVGHAPGQAHAQSHPVVFNHNMPSGQDIIQFATASLQGGDVEPVSTGVKSGYTDLVESHGGGGPHRDPLGLPPTEGPDGKAPKTRKPPAQGMIKDLSRIILDHMEGNT